jgi:acetyl-CoA acetyltransferase
MSAAYVYEAVRAPFGRRGGGYGVATLCIGVGPGLAVVLEGES